MIEAKSNKGITEKSEINSSQSKNDLDHSYLDDLPASRFLIEVSLKENLNFIRENDIILANGSSLSKVQVESFCKEQRYFMKQYFNALLEKMNLQEF